MPIPLPEINVEPVKVHVSLRIRRLKIDCERISSLLNLSATSIRLYDEPDPEQIFVSATNEDVWFIESKGEVHSNDLHDHFSWLLFKLNGKAEVVQLLREEGYTVMTAVYCMANSENTELSISRQVIHALSELNLSLWFDFYHDDGTYEYSENDDEERKACD